MKVPIHILVIANSKNPIKKYLQELSRDYVICFNRELSKTTIETVLEETTIDLVLIAYTTIENIPNQLAILVDEYPLLPFIVLGKSIAIRSKTMLLKAGARAGLSEAELEHLPILIEREVIHTRRLKKLKESEKQLKQENDLLDGLYNNAHEAILIHDYDEIKYVNQPFLDQLGYEDSQELLRKAPLKTIVCSEDIAAVTATQTQRTSESRLMVSQVQLLKKDGSLLLIDLQVRSVLIKKKWFAQIMLQAITDKKSVQAYIAEKERNNLLSKHVEQVPGIIYQFQMFEDGSYCFPFVSNRIYDLYGISPKELMDDGSRFFHYMHKEDIPLFLESGYLSKATMEEWRLDYRVDVPEYGIRWMRGTSKPVTMPDGSTLWYGYVADITKEKKASAALRDSEEQIQTMFTYAPDGILLMDMYGRITKWNPKATAIFGWTEKEALGQKMFKLIGPKRNYERYQENVDSYKKEKKGVILNQALEVRAIHKNGREFSIVMALSAMTIKNQEFFICFMSDITKRKNAEDRLKQSLREKEVLLKEIHHRVKNNMQVITSLLSLQSSFIDDDKIKTIFRNSQYRINSMGMVHEMLYQSEDLSKINYGNYLGRLIWGLIEAMKGSRNTIDLKLDVPNITLNVDTAIPLGLIINELVTNSLKYGFPDNRKGTIVVRLTNLEYPNFRLEIGDDGIGMLSNSKMRASQSLGLMLVNRLAIQLKGTIQYLKDKKGTHYVLSFQEIYQFNP